MTDKVTSIKDDVDDTPHVPLVRKNGEVNGRFGAFCNKIMQIGGAALVIAAVPSLLAVLWQTYTISIQNQSTQQQIQIALTHMVGQGTLDAEIKRLDESDKSLQEKDADIEKTMDKNYSEANARFAKLGDLIRDHRSLHIRSK